MFSQAPVAGLGGRRAEMTDTRSEQRKGFGR